MEGLEPESSGIGVFVIHTLFQDSLSGLILDVQNSCRPASNLAPPSASMVKMTTALRVLLMAVDENCLLSKRMDLNTPIARSAVRSTAFRNRSLLSKQRSMA